VKTKNLFFALLMILGINQLTTAQVTFQKTYGRSSYDAANYVQQTSDGGYFIVGSTADHITEYRDFLLIRTDAGGDTLWTKTYGGINNDDGNSVQQTSEGGFILAGSSMSFGEGNGDALLIKTSANGDVVWAKSYGGVDSDNGLNVHQTSDGGYILAGNTMSFGAGYFDVYLIKTTANGDTAWTRTYGGPGGDFAYSVQQTTDGGYIIAGLTTSAGAGGADAFLIKTTASGDTLWTKTYGGASTDGGYTVEQTTDGGYMLTGYSQSFGPGTYNIYLIRTTATGDTVWTKTYGHGAYDHALSGSLTSDGGVIITGQTNCCSSGDYDAFAIKTNATGDTLWTKTYGGPNDGNGGPNDEWGYSMMQTSDGGYIMGGATHSFNSDSTDFYMVKTDANGNSGCSQKGMAPTISSSNTIVENWTPVVKRPATVVSNQIITTGKGVSVHPVCTTYGISDITGLNSFSIYPNPASGNFTLELNSGFTATNIQIFNTLGALVYEQAISQLSTNINLNAPAGIYFVKVSDSDKMHTQKLIIE